MGTLNLNSIMVSSENPKILIAFYKKIINKPATMEESDWAGWMLGSTFFGIGPHSEVKGKSKEPARIMINIETPDVKAEFDRIKNTGAKIIKELYEMEGVSIATFEDPDGNYFQIMSPWEQK